MQSEIGVHRLVRISPFGSGDTRQTSFAAVDVLPELDDDIEIEVKENDLEMQTFCSGGPGGQHQNKTQSGVRLIHKSGVRAESRTERSQHKNYDNALKLAQGPALRDRGAEADWATWRSATTPRAKSPSAARSAATCCSRTRWSATSGRDRREDAGGDERPRRRPRPVHARLPAAQDGEAAQEEVASEE